MAQAFSLFCWLLRSISQSIEEKPKQPMPCCPPRVSAVEPCGSRFLPEGKAAPTRDQSMRSISTVVWAWQPSRASPPGTTVIWGCSISTSNTGSKSSGCLSAGQGYRVTGSRLQAKVNGLLAQRVCFFPHVDHINLQPCPVMYTHNQYYTTRHHVIQP